MPRDDPRPRALTRFSSLPRIVDNSPIDSKQTQIGPAMGTLTPSQDPAETLAVRRAVTEPVHHATGRESRATDAFVQAYARGLSIQVHSQPSQPSRCANATPTVSVTT